MRFSSSVSLRDLFSPPLFFESESESSGDSSGSGLFLIFLAALPLAAGSLRFCPAGALAAPAPAPAGALRFDIVGVVFASSSLFDSSWCACVKRKRPLAAWLAALAFCCA